MAYKYCTATNTGKDFFTHEDRTRFHLEGHPGNVWITGDNNYGVAWISKISGTVKTKSEAQAIVTGVIETAQGVWDNDNVSGESSDEKIRRLQDRPATYNII
jgi:hypothetical protein